MPIRTVKQYSDRGSLKNLSQRHEDEVPYSTIELRIKKLYDYAHTHADASVLDCLGFITTEYINDKNALPLSVYRLRKIVSDISNKSGNKILKMKQDLDNCFFSSEKHCLTAIKSESRQRESLIKVASADRSLDLSKRSFRRAGE